MSLEHNSEIKWVEIATLVPNPKNNNQHDDEQIERLAKILKWQGFRSPIQASNRSGFVVVGHARLEAAKVLGLTKVPVSYQDFESEAQEYAHMTADNEIARWAKLDVEDMRLETIDWADELDPDFLGIKDFSFGIDDDLEDEEKKDLGDGSDNPIKNISFAFTNAQAKKVEEAISLIKKEKLHKQYEETEDYKNSNANSMYYMVEGFLNGFQRQESDS